MRLGLVLVAAWGLAACAPPRAQPKPGDVMDPEYFRVFCKAKGGQLAETPLTSADGRTQSVYACHIPRPARNKAG